MMELFTSSIVFPILAVTSLVNILKAIILFRKKPILRTYLFYGQTFIFLVLISFFVFDFFKINIFMGLFILVVGVFLPIGYKAAFEYFSFKITFLNIDNKIEEVIAKILTEKGINYKQGIGKFDLHEIESSIIIDYNIKNIEAIVKVKSPNHRKELINLIKKEVYQEIKNYKCPNFSIGAVTSLGYALILIGFFILFAYLYR